MTVCDRRITPRIGLAAVDHLALLARNMGGVRAFGWLGYVLSGAALAVVYAIVQSRLPGPPVRGAQFGVVLWGPHS